MNLTFECPACKIAQRVDFHASEQAVTCPGCSSVVPLKPGAAEGAQVKACPLCGTSDMYIQKDFPHRLGMSIVLVATVLSCIAWWQYWYLPALGILLAAAFVDFCLFHLIGDVLICYRCLAQYRGAERNPAHEPFDLGIGERYRQERIRLQALRRAGSGEKTDAQGDGTAPADTVAQSRGGAVAGADDPS